MSDNVTPFKRDLRIHGKIPQVGHIPRSYEFLVRDGIMARIKLMPWFKSFARFSTNKAEQIQPENIPFVGVYFISKTGRPDGDANTGEVRFKTLARYGFSVIVQNNNAEKAEQHLDDAYQVLTRTLFGDPTLYGNEDALIEAFTAETRTHVFGSAGADNMIPIAELRWDLTCDLGVVTYEPFIPDMLEVIDVTTSDDAAIVPVHYTIEQDG